MFNPKTIQSIFLKTKQNIRAVLAVSATLVFGASLIGLMQFSLSGEDRGLVLAGVFDGSFVNICGTISAPPGSWSEHDANPACHGCYESGYCAGNAVWVFSCEPGQEISNIECRANGSSVGTRADFNPTFDDPCKMYQIDVFDDGPGGILRDFVVWEGKWFREPYYSQYCLPNPSCPYTSTQARVHETSQDQWSPSITVNEGSQFIGGGFHNNTGQFASDVILRVTRPNGTQFNISNGQAVTNLVPGVYTLHVYTDGYPENEPNCFEIATVTVNPVTQPATCQSITGPSGTINPADYPNGMTYTGQINTGTPQNLQWYLDGSPILGATGLSVIISTPVSGTHTVRLSVNGDNVGACVKSFTIEIPTPATCQSITGPSGTINPADYPNGMTYTGQINTGSPQNLQWYLDGSPILGATGLSVIISTPASGTHTVRLSVNGDNVGTCVKSFTIEIPIPLQPELVCDSKTIDQNEVEIGDEVTFSINYSNIGDATAISVFAKEDYLGDGYANLRNFRVVIGSSTFTLDPNTCNEQVFLGNGCPLLNVPANSNASLLFEADIESLDDLEEIAYLEYNNDERTNDCPFTPPTPVIPEPEVDCVEKSAEHEYASDIKVGDIVTYTIEYSSLNQPEGEFILINDTLDNDLEFVSFQNGSENHCTYNNNSREIICSVAGNQEGEIFYSAVILNDGEIINQAVVTDNYDHSDSTNCKVEFDARPLIDELVCVSKDADDTHMNYGDEGDFVITYQNIGETILNGVILHDTLPVGMEFVSAEDDLCRVLTPEELSPFGPAVSSITETVRCESTDVLQPRDRATFRFTIRINDEAPAGGSLVNEVSSLFSEEVEGDISACTEKVFINLPKPSIIVIKETKSPADKTMILGDDAETPDDYVKFRITVTNNGPTTLVEVPLYDKFYADDYELVSASPEPDSTEYINAARPLMKLFWNDLGELNPGESTVIEIVLKALETHTADKLINYSKVEDAVDENGVTVDSNIDDDYVIIEGSILGEQLNFNIVKTLVTENPTKKGEVVKFHIVITNTGTKTIEIIKLVDDYDTNYLEFTDFSAKISHDSSLYYVNTGDGEFTHFNILSGLDFLEPGEEIELDIWFLAKNKDGETINLAEITAEDFVDFDTAKVTIIVEELADTGQDILAILAIGMVLATLGVVGVKYLKKKE